MDQRFDCGIATPFLTQCPVLHWRWALQFPSPHCMAFHLESFPLSPESLSPPRSLVHFRGSSQPPTSQGCLFPVLQLALRASVIFPYPIPDHVPLSRPSPVPFPFQAPPYLPLVVVLFSLQGVLTWALKLVDLSEFCGLYLGYSVFFFN